MMRLEYHEQAKGDIIRASLWYDQEELGGGDRFLAAVEAVAERIASFPEAWRIEARDIYSARCQPYPYSVYYRLDEELIVIIGVFHSRQEVHPWWERT